MTSKQMFADSLVKGKLRFIYGAIINPQNESYGVHPVLLIVNQDLEIDPAEYVYLQTQANNPTIDLEKCSIFVSVSNIEEVLEKYERRKRDTDK